MKHKILAIAGSIVASAPTISIAEVLPENLVGLNLGEIRANSFLNQPFKGVIPLLFSSFDDSKNLKIKLAPDAIFNKVGAEKLPILQKLNFQVVNQNKPVILISSSEPINTPFLNFILEIRDSKSVVYQDYTVLIDPESKKSATQSKVKNATADSFNNEQVFSSKQTISKSKKISAKNKTLFPSTNTNLAISAKQNNTYKVKAGDSVSKIALKQSKNRSNLKRISKLIFTQNPDAFINGNINKLKKGVILNLPSLADINDSKIVDTKSLEKDSLETNNNNAITQKIETAAALEPVNQNIYTVKKGDSLSKITNKFITKKTSFSGLLNTIYNENPTAFIDNNINKLKIGAKLVISSSPESTPESNIAISKSEQIEKPLIKKPVETLTKSIASVLEKPQTDNLISKAVAADETNFIVDKYQIQEGDTLSKITNKIGYQEVPFAQMLKAIYEYNPHAFIDGKMNNLAIGSFIDLPPFENFGEISVSQQLSSYVDLTENKPKNKSVNVVKTGINTVATDSLNKRIRELRKELLQTKEELSVLKNKLSNKEALLEQKDIQLESLNTLIASYDQNFETKELEAIAVKTALVTTKEKDTTKRISKAEMAQLKRELLIKNKKTEKQIAEIEELREKTSIFNFSLIQEKTKGLYNHNKISSLIDLSNANYAYLTMALILSLLLIRYRRELYSYSYSKINFDKTEYHPIPESDKYDLNEKNITFNNSNPEAEDLSSYDIIVNNKTDVDTQEDKINESPQQSILIDKLLDDINDEDEIKEDTLIEEASEEDKQIEYCESLITELFDDLNNDHNSLYKSEWENIEEVCDNYIDQFKNNSLNSNITKDGAMIDKAVDFNDMMSDLLESLDQVDKSIIKNKKLSDKLTDL